MYPDNASGMNAGYVLASYSTHTVLIPIRNTRINTAFPVRVVFKYQLDNPKGVILHIHGSTSCGFLPTYQYG